MPITTYTAGQVLTAASLNSNFAAGNLFFIKSETIGSAVSSVTVSDAFSSTYENYKIILSGGVASTTSTLVMTLGATVTGYYWAINSCTFAAVAGGNGAENTSSWRVGGGTTAILSGSIELFGPNLANETVYNANYQLNATSGGAAVAAGGFLNNTTQYTAFTITTSSGTLTGGTIRVYGIQNS